MLLLHFLHARRLLTHLAVELRFLGFEFEFFLGLFELFDFLLGFAQGFLVAE